MADDFLSGTTSAVHGGTTTIIPFACQFKGQSLNDVVADYHARAEGKAVIDYAFHLIVSDPSPNVLETELPNLIANGYTHFKLYMTYDDMKLNDRQMLDVLYVARRHGAMVMIHAENSDCIAWLTDRLEQAGKTAPHYHAVSRPPVVEREATYRAIAFSDLMDTPDPDCPCVGRRGDEGNQTSAGARITDIWRNLSAIPVSDFRGSAEGWV